MVHRSPGDWYLCARVACQMATFAAENDRQKADIMWTRRALAALLFAFGDDEALVREKAAVGDESIRWLNDWRPPEL